jgi:hypothetical protein
VNDLKQKLIEQAGFHIQPSIENAAEGIDWASGSYGYDACVDKLIELVMMECIECIQLTTARDPRATPQYKQSVGHIHRIRQHFGIEEKPTPVINVDMVKRLREETNRPMMYCKMALYACDGDYGNAKQWLTNSRNFITKI